MCRHEMYDNWLWMAHPDRARVPKQTEDDNATYWHAMTMFTNYTGSMMHHSDGSLVSNEIQMACTEDTAVSQGYCAAEQECDLHF
jgi:pyoverdine/dityrosine biosynthesis protein Dit1